MGKKRGGQPPVPDLIKIEVKAEEEDLGNVVQ